MQRSRPLAWFLLSALLVAALGWLVSAPGGFPAGADVTVAKGASIREAAADFGAAGAVRSERLLRGLLEAASVAGLGSVKAGEYHLSRPLSAVEVALMLVSGSFGFSRVKVTLPEGLSAREMAADIAPLLPRFDEQAFLALAVPKEGYLFPSTYFFSQNADAQAVFDALMGTFETQEARIAGEVSAFGRPLADVVSMASILEEEARTDQDRRIVAGILWKRLDLGMPLQVDSSLRYATGKASADLTAADLKSDSPYNTYVHRGLPPTPISNPGLGSLEDAVAPIATDYLYFLSGSDGVMHYASTLEGHILNEQRYLKR